MTGKHERIWLEPTPESEPDLGRQWCQNNVWGDEATEYVRADILALPEMASGALNDAGWALSSELAKYGPLNGHQFNNLKSVLFEVLKVYLPARQKECAEKQGAKS